MKNRIDFWDDRLIKAGKDWRTEIHNTLQRADVAILLASRIFWLPNLFTKRKSLFYWKEGLMMVSTTDGFTRVIGVTDLIK